MEKMRKNFTLIELLVVIAIIAILAGILLPALNSARDKAMQTQCLNQMKSMTTAAIMYCDNFDGWLMPVKEAPLANRPDPMWSANRAFLDLAHIKYADYEPLYSHYWNGKYVCPRALPNTSVAGVVGPFFYGLQNFPGGMSSANDYWSAQNYIRPSREVKSPSAKAFIVESLQAPDGGGVCSPASTSLETWFEYANVPVPITGMLIEGDYKTYLAYRHGGLRTINFSFYDGHAANLKESATRVLNNFQFNPKMYWYAQ